VHIVPLDDRGEQPEPGASAPSTNFR